MVLGALGVCFHQKVRLMRRDAMNYREWYFRLFRDGLAYNIIKVLQCLLQPNQPSSI
jgi:hypothetical protein